MNEKDARKVYDHYEDATMVYSLVGKGNRKQNECKHSFPFLSDLLPDKTLVRAVEDGTRNAKSVVKDFVSVLKKPHRIAEEERVPSIYKTLFCVYTVLSNETKMARTGKGKLNTITIFIIPDESESTRKKSQLISLWIKSIFKVYGVTLASTKEVFKVVFGKRYKKVLGGDDNVKSLSAKKISDGIDKFNSKTRKKLRDEDPDKLIQANESREFIGLCCKPEYLLTAAMQDGVIKSSSDNFEQKKSRKMTKSEKKYSKNLARNILSVISVSSAVRVSEFKGFSSKSLKKMKKSISRLDKECRDYAIEFVNIMISAGLNEGDRKIIVPKKYSENDKFVKSFEKACKKLGNNPDIMLGMIAYIVSRKTTKNKYAYASVKSAKDVMEHYMRHSDFDLNAFMESAEKLGKQ